MGTPKILYVITKATAGGAQLYVEELAQAGKARGYDVAVVYGTKGQLADRLEEGGVRTIPVERLSRDVRVSDEFKVFGDLLQIFKTERPDVVHVNSSKAGGLGALAARLTGVRTIIYTAHGWPHKEPRALPARLMIWLLSWITILLSTRVVVVSEDDLHRAPVFFSKSKLRLIRNGIGNFEHLSKEDARKKLADRFGKTIPNNRWLFALGELHRNKGFDVLLEAFAKIAEKHANTHLVILGGGEEETTLRKLIEQHLLQDRVSLLGYVPNGRTYLEAGDIFVFPSRKEGLPFALLEAGKVGLPVIASRVGGIPEVVTHEKTGLLVPSRNPNALADAITTLLSHPDRARAYGSALKDAVETRFSQEQMTEETFALYKR